MKSKKLFFLAYLLFGCGGITVNTPKDANLNVGTDSGTDTSVATSTDTSIGSTSPAAQVSPVETVKTPATAQTVKASADPQCGASYTSKIVYQDGDQTFYACINGHDGEKAPKDKQTPDVLDHCPYTYSLEQDGAIRLTYVVLPTDQHPKEIPSYLISKGPFYHPTPMEDSEGNFVCRVDYWDGTTLQYEDFRGRVLEKSFE